MTKAVHEIEGLKWVRIGDTEHAAEIRKYRGSGTWFGAVEEERIDRGVVITNKKGGICWLPGVSIRDITRTIEENTAWKDK